MQYSAVIYVVLSAILSVILCDYVRDNPSIPGTAVARDISLCAFIGGKAR